MINTNNNNKIIICIELNFFFNKQENIKRDFFIMYCLLFNKNDWFWYLKRSLLMLEKIFKLKSKYLGNKIYFLIEN